MDEYAEFLKSREHYVERHGFEPVLPAHLFDFQRALVEWAVWKGRAAVFADCGMGKSAIALAWADNVARHTGRRVLVLTPIAVGAQMVAEAAKFGVEAERVRGGSLGKARVLITNYEQLPHYKSHDFAGAVCDESSILKNFDGVTKARVTEFLRPLAFRLLTTATAAPNDFTELGTSSEALGYLGHMDMLGRFFKNDSNTCDTGRKWVGQSGGSVRWRFKGHAEQPFWRWVCSWARALRRPSDLGDYSDERFALPPLVEREHVVRAARPREGCLFALPAHGLKEQREERRRTLRERCERAAALVADTGQPAVCWAALNDEADLLEELVPDAVQVSGADSDEAKEEKFLAFQAGQARVLVIKPVIGAWGLNWQHCAHMTVFAAYSFEQYYQGVRRCWRFGQTRPVHVEHVLSDGESEVLSSRQRKAQAADKMFASLVTHMRDELGLSKRPVSSLSVEVPSWL